MTPDLDPENPGTRTLKQLFPIRKEGLRWLLKSGYRKAKICCEMNRPNGDNKWCTMKGLWLRSPVNKGL